MNSKTPLSPAGGNGIPASPILSDEEIRARAAAFAQRVYEQQLEVYRAQRERLLAAERARLEYERQWQAYEQARRDFEVRQNAQPAVRIDPATGEQVYAKSQDASLNEFPEEPVPISDDVFVAAEPAFVSEKEFEEEEESPVFDPDSEEEDESDFDEDGDEEEPSADEEMSEQEETSDVQEAKVKKTTGTRDSGFTPFSMLLIVICAAVLAAIGYILFSDDPRFERQRTEFFSLIKWDKTEASSDEGKSISWDEEFDAAEKELSEEDSEDDPFGTTSGED